MQVVKSGCAPPPSGGLVPGPDAGQVGQGGVQAAFLVGLQGNEGPAPPAGQVVESFSEGDPAGAQGQVGVVIPVVVVEMQVPDDRGQSFEP